VGTLPCVVKRKPQLFGAEKERGGKKGASGSEKGFGGFSLQKTIQLPNSTCSSCTRNRRKTRCSHRFTMPCFSKTGIDLDGSVVSPQWTNPLGPQPAEGRTQKTRNYSSAYNHRPHRSKKRKKGSESKTVRRAKRKNCNCTNRTCQQVAANYRAVGGER